MSTRESRMKDIHCLTDPIRPLEAVNDVLVKLDIPEND